MKDAISPSRKTGRPLSFDRDAALNKAMLTFWRHGYEATSINELTQAMGITPPSLYTSFVDKKRLFLEAMRLYAGDPATLQASLDEAPTAREAAHEMLRASALAFTGEDTPKGCLLASATASVGAAAEDVQRAVTEVRQDILSRLERRIAADQAHALLPGNCDAHALAAMVIAVIQGMSVLARDGVERGALEKMIEVTMRAWPD